MKGGVGLILVGFFASGCDLGAQRGKFTVSGSGTRSLDKVCGDLIVVRGSSALVDPTHQTAQPLLYVLVVVPGFNATGSGHGGSSSTLVSTEKWHYSNATERVEGELSWNRDTEEVNVGGAKFDRAKGQAFVVIRDSKGKWIANQYSIKKTMSDNEALEEIKKALPSDSPAKSVTLYPLGGLVP